MPLADLYVIAAGKGSRINLNIPKALIGICDEPCLTLNLRQIGGKFRRVFVVTNVLIQDKWQAYFDSLLESDPAIAASTVNLPIVSGLGDGHATLEAIRAAQKREGHELSPDIVVAWGDVLFPTGSLIDELLSLKPRGSGILPVIKEEDPYVSLLVDESMRCLSADFAKHGERRPYGFHDQSVFRFDLPLLTLALSELHNALWKNGRYITPSGELSLLYSFHYLYNASSPAYVYETTHSTLGFNTLEEMLAIQRRFSSLRNESKTANGGGAIGS